VDQRVGVCNLCEAVCGLEFTIEDNVITAVRGNAEDPLSRGHLCAKGAAMVDVYNDPDRLRRPMQRAYDTEGQEYWQEVSWEVAFNVASAGLAAVMREHGRDGLGVYLGNPNAHSLGSMTHAPAMVRALGTRNRFSATSVDQLPHQLVAHLMFGHQLLLPIPDIDRTTYFCVVGANPMASNGSLMTAPGFPRRIRELKARGGHVVVFDPRRTETAAVADEHVFVLPGSDAFVLLAMLHALLAEHDVTVPEYVRGFDAVRSAVAPYTPELAEERSGVTAATIRRVTAELASAQSGVVYGRIGVSTHDFGTVCQWAINCLNLLSGNLDQVGGAMFTSPAIDLIGQKLVRRGHFGTYLSRIRGLPEFSGELPVAALAEEIETPGGGQIRGMLVVAGNPVLSTPDGARLSRALESLDFMVAVDFYINETTRHADIILPPTSALERDHYDLLFHTLAVRNTARFTPAVMTAAADRRHDWEIFRDLTGKTLAKLGGRGSLLRRLQARIRLGQNPTRLVAILLRRGRGKVTLAKLRRSPAGIDLGPLEPGRLPTRLQTPDQLLQLAPMLVLENLTRLASQPRPAAGELVLIGRRHQKDCNSWLHNTTRLTRGQPRHHLMMHPEDLKTRGISDGATVRITSRIGSVETEVLSTDDMMPGVVSLPHGYGHHGPGLQLRNAAKLPGVSINDLTDPARIDVSGNAALTGVPVSVEAIDSPPESRG
jgi:anaerobic selenocysteine-containing dehydrogenase